VREVYHKLQEKLSTIAELRTTLSAEDLKRTSSKTSDIDCSELLQEFARVREQGWRTLRTFHLTYSVNTASLIVI